MTVAALPSFVRYIGNGVTTNFPFSFSVRDSSHLKVYLETIATGVESLLTPGTYSITGIPGAGSVTYNPGGTPVPATKALIIRRIVPLTQDMDITSEGGFDPTILEEQLDRIVMMAQQNSTSIQELIGEVEGTIPLPNARVKRFALTTGQSQFANTLPMPSTWPNNLFIWNYTWPMEDTPGTDFTLADPAYMNVVWQLFGEYAIAHPLEDIYVCNVPYPGISIDNWQPAPPVKDMRARITANIVPALAKAGCTTVDFLAFWQGETPGTGDWRTKFNALWTWAATQSWYVPAGTPLIMFGLAPTSINAVTGLFNNQIINAAQDDVENRVFVYADPAVIPAGEWNADTIHMLALGYKHYGSLAYHQWMEGRGQAYHSQQIAQDPYTKEIGIGQKPTPGVKLGVTQDQNAASYLRMSNIHAGASAISIVEALSNAGSMAISAFSTAAGALGTVVSTLAGGMLVKTTVGDIIAQVPTAKSHIWQVNGVTRLSLTAAGLAVAATGAFWQDAGAEIHRLNDRMMVGGATINDGKAVPVVKDWLETLRDSTTKNSQVAVLSTIGQTAILAGTRTSDFPLAGGQGSIGFQGWAINDDAVGVQASWAAYLEARRSAGAGSTFGLEAEVANFGSVVDINAYGTYGPTTGLTAALWTASGGEVGTADASVMLGVVNNARRFRKGIVFTYNSLTGTDGAGAGTTGVAMELARGHKLTWARQDGTEAANIYSDLTNGGALQSIRFTDVGLLLRNSTEKNLLQVVASSSYVNGFVLTPTVTTGQPVVSVAGDDTNISFGHATKGTGVHDFFTNGTVRQFQIAHVASAVNYLQLKGAATAGSPQLSALGSDTNVNLGFATQGTGLFDFFTAGSVRQFRIYDTPSAVNYIQLSGSATGAATTLASVGADTNVNMVVSTKGSGSVFLNSNGTIVAEFQNPASVVNRFLLQGTVTTGSPIIVATGTDTNVGGILRGKGTGGFDLQDGASASKFKINTTGIGFFNVTPVAKATVGAALSTGGAETNVNLATRINELRTALINYGLAA